MYTFYLYQAVTGEDRGLEGTNAGNLAATLWQLQNAAGNGRPPRRGDTRLVRYRVQTRATQPLLDRGMNFGVGFSFDSGRCTGPWDCDEAWRRYGYFVGCNRLGDRVHYPNAVQYSLPGPCPSSAFWDKTQACSARQPGGACAGQPSGRGDCTYSYEPAGELRLSDLEGPDPEDFWRGPTDDRRCADRLEAARGLFVARYPGGRRDADLPTPLCDASFDRFYD